MKLGAKTTSGWKATISVAMSNYIEAGSIIAIATSLGFWQERFGISDFAVGLLAALSANAFGAAIGAVLGGPLCDRFGRKAIYTYDLIVYMVGVLLAAFAVNYTMLLAAFIITGIAVGAGIPASWTYIAEQAPARERATPRRHRPAGLVDRPVDRLRPRRGARPAGAARIAADLPPSVRRRRRGLVDPARSRRIADLERRGPRRQQGRACRIEDRRQRTPWSVLPPRQHHRACCSCRDLRLLEHRRRPGRHLHAPRLRHRWPAQRRRAGPAAGPGVGVHGGRNLLRVHALRRQDVAATALRHRRGTGHRSPGSSW